MDTIEKKQEKFKLVKEQRQILEKADKESRKLDQREKATFDTLSYRVEELEKDILEEEGDLERRRKLAEKEIAGLRSNRKMEIDSSKEFRNGAEFLHALARQKADGFRDPRLDELNDRAMSMGTGSQGGFALPDQFDATVRQVVASDSVVRSRATVIPAGDPPDAKLSFPALDQTSGSNMYGGVAIYHSGEGLTMTETSMALREVTMEPKEMSAYIIVTNKLLNNWASAGTFISRTLSAAMMGAEDYDFLRGDGVNKALGVINSPAAITLNRSGAGVVAFIDTYTMLARALMRGGSSYVWVASQTIIPQLAAMVDAGGHAVWLGSKADALPGAQGPLPSSLLGIPVIFSDRMPALGTKGDINLLNLSYYMIKDGSGPYVASSEHILFLSNRTVFKIVWNVDAKPWLTEPLILEGSSTSTVSPFINLSTL